MFTTAEALEQSNATPTDWSKFDGTLMPARAGEPGGLPPGMGPGWDDKLHVRFFMRPRIDPAASTIENRPIYKDVPHIEIMIPGDKNNIVTAEVWEQHIKRFPEHWKQFQAGIKDQVIGTPLRAAPFLTEAQCEELAYFKIRTIEQLADLQDGNMGFMGARELQQAAKKYIEKTRGADALMTRLDAIEARAAAAEAALAEANAKLAEATAKVPFNPKRG
jgi:hypothetical protein